MKRCTTCGEEKLESDFGKNSRLKSGLLSACKSCMIKKGKIYYEKNKDRIIKRNEGYVIKNLDIVKQRRKIYNQRVKEKQKAYFKDYRKKNRESIYAKRRQHRIDNLERYRKSEKEKRARLKKESPIFCLTNLLRQRLRQELLRSLTQKTNKALSLLGCSPNFLKEYLESKFLPGMTWENRGKKGWHIDHIMPVSSFDLTDLEEQKKCFHYTNLQPLWWLDNLRKGKTLPISEEGSTKAAESSSEALPSPEPQPAARA